MPAHAKLSVHVRSRRLADAIARSLRPEVDHPVGSKARVAIRVDQKILELKFLAKDTTALRAVMNSYLRIISACLKVTEAIELEKVR
jgi:tRNA threonylcarbamoyladenosine modification (KEOPS) complex  Pcc1 subunit